MGDRDMVGEVDKKVLTFKQIDDAFNNNSAAPLQNIDLQASFDSFENNEKESFIARLIEIVTKNQGFLPVLDQAIEKSIIKINNPRGDAPTPLLYLAKELTKENFYNVMPAMQRLIDAGTNLKTIFNDYYDNKKTQPTLFDILQTKLEEAPKNDTIYVDALTCVIDEIKQNTTNDQVAALEVPPMIKACKSLLIDQAKEILKSTPNAISTTDAYQNTPVIAAFKYSFLREDKEYIAILDLVATSSDIINAKDKYGRTAFMYYLLNNNNSNDQNKITTNVVDKFIAQGADINAYDNNNKTVLDIFCEKHTDSRIINALKEKGAKTFAELQINTNTETLSIPIETSTNEPAEIFASVWNLRDKWDNIGNTQEHKNTFYDTLTKALKELEKTTPTQQDIVDAVEKTNPELSAGTLGQCIKNSLIKIQSDSFKGLAVGEQDTYCGIGARSVFTEQGIKINYVIPGGPADKMGLKEGYIITNIAGIDLTGEHKDGFFTQDGRTLTRQEVVGISRQGNNFTVQDQQGKLVEITDNIIPTYIDRAAGATLENSIKDEKMKDLAKVAATTTVKVSVTGAKANTPYSSAKPNSRTV